VVRVTKITGLLESWLQVFLITFKYSTIADSHDFLFTVAHELGFSAFTSRLLATDLNTETSTSNHYEVFLLLRLQLLWNLGPKNSSGLIPPAYDYLVTASELILSLPRLFWESYVAAARTTQKTQPLSNGMITKNRSSRERFYQLVA
jgi:hypothetical protein